MRYYCTFENRKSAFIGLKLLALSLEEHCRDFTFFVGITGKAPQLSDWLSRHAPHAVLVHLDDFKKGSSLKHVKAVLILALFDRGITDVTWLDTDLLVLRDLEPLLAPLAPDTILVAQEDMGRDFEFNRTLLNHYRLKPLRRLEFHVNSCVIRATIQHRPLMERFLACLLDPVFVEQQSKSEAEKIPDFAFEQNIIEMLLSSSDDTWHPAFPVEFIPKGPGIIQELGVTTYKLRNRLRNGLGLRHPWMVHVPGVTKPWNTDARSRRARAACVYSAFAEAYRDRVEEDMSWANSAGLSSRIGRLLSFGQPHWVGWAHCLVGQLWRFLRTGTLERKVTPDPNAKVPQPDDAELPCGSR